MEYRLIMQSLTLPVAYFLLIASCFLSIESRADENPTLAIVILSQPTEWHEGNAQRLKESLKEEIPEALVLDTVKDFGHVHGAWAVLPLLASLYDRLGGNGSTVRWVLICEDGTIVKGKRLVDFLKKFDASEPIFAGHALRDTSATIIHHFAFIGENTTKFAYPDFSGGVLLSWPMMERLVKKLRAGQKPRDFAIDPKHELAMLAYEDGKTGVDLIHVPEFCTTTRGDQCVTELGAVGDYHSCPGQSTPTINDDITFAVKTFHEFHKTRVVAVKRTWGLQARNIEFFSDREDHYIPSIMLGLDNTERGHCAKTFGIMRHFVENHASSKKWLVIADDDSLLSIPRLVQLLNCYDHTRALIVGERYGYGFDAEGRNGYAYPTGGSGMAFTAAAVAKLVEKCNCPSPESPDDMILGVCAHNADVALIHSQAMHQARPYDYADDYLGKVKPISFHKHWECDPYLVYSQWLVDEKTPTDDQGEDKSKKTLGHSHDSEL